MDGAARPSAFRLLCWFSFYQMNLFVHFLQTVFLIAAAGLRDKLEIRPSCVEIVFKDGP